jgi:transposase IS4 family protein
VSLYVRTVRTAFRAVQIAHSSSCWGSRNIEHIGSAHDDAEPAALKEVAGQRLSPGPFVRLSGATRSINRDPGETGPDPGRLEGTRRCLPDPDPETVISAYHRLCSIEKSLAHVQSPT